MKDIVTAIKKLHQGYPTPAIEIAKEYDTVKDVSEYLLAGIFNADG